MGLHPSHFTPKARASADYIVRGIVPPPNLLAPEAFEMVARAAVEEMIPADTINKLLARIAHDKNTSQEGVRGDKPAPSGSDMRSPGAAK